MVQRLRLIVDYLKSSKQIRNQQDFVERVGSDKSAVSLILNGKRQITKQFVSSVCEAFPFISEDWLLYGSGEMLSGQVEARVNHDKRGVPYYDVDFIGGFDVVLNDQSVVPAYYIDFPIYNNADYWVNVSGRSMEPLISSGDAVAITHLHDWELYILFGEVYAIVTDSYRTIKKIRRSSLGDDYILLVPINPEYDEQNIPRSIVRIIYKVIGVVKKII